MLVCVVILCAVIVFSMIKECSDGRDTAPIVIDITPADTAAALVTPAADTMKRPVKKRSGRTRTPYRSPGSRDFLHEPF